MNNKILVPGLLLIFVALLGFSVWQTNQQNNPAARDTIANTDNRNVALAQRIYTDIDVDDIASVSVLDPFTRLSMTFTRTESGWDIAELALPVDPQQAEAIAQTVAQLPYLQILDGITSEEYAEYGLEDDSIFLLLSLILKDNTQHAVIIGDVAPGSAGHYALVDDREEMYLVDARPIAYLTAVFRQLYATSTESE